AQLRQPVGDRERSVATDRHQPVQPQLSIALQRHLGEILLHHHPCLLHRVAKRIGPVRSTKNGPTLRKNPPRVAHGQWSGQVRLEQAHVAFLNPYYLVAEFRNSPFDQAPDQGIEPWAVSTARQHSESHRKTSWSSG